MMSAAGSLCWVWSHGRSRRLRRNWTRRQEKLHHQQSRDTTTSSRRNHNQWGRDLSRLSNLHQILEQNMSRRLRITTDWRHLTIRRWRWGFYCWELFPWHIETQYLCCGFRLMRQTWSSSPPRSMMNRRSWRNREQSSTESWPTPVRTTTRKPTSSSLLSMHM